MHEFPCLETPRLVLREILASDVPALMDMYRNQEAMKWRGDDHLTTSEAVENMVNAFAAARPVHGDTHWGLELKSSPGLIGKCGLHGIHHSIHKCMLAYEMENSHRGRGYMAEALVAILQWLFTQTLMNRVGALVAPANMGSLRLLERMGFQPEGLQRDAARWSDTYHDMLGFGLLRPEFLAALPEIQARLAVDGVISQYLAPGRQAA